MLVVDIDPQLSPYLFNLCVGFQARPNNTQTMNKSKKGTQEEKKDEKKEEKKNELDTSHVVVRRNSRMGTITPGGSRLIGGGTQTSNGLQSGTGFQINALEPNEQQLELDHWHCATATYDIGKIICQ